MYVCTFCPQFPGPRPFPRQLRVCAWPGSLCVSLRISRSSILHANPKHWKHPKKHTEKSVQPSSELIAALVAGQSQQSGFISIATSAMNSFCSTRSVSLFWERSWRPQGYKLKTTIFQLYSSEKIQSSVITNRLAIKTCGSPTNLCRNMQIISVVGQKRGREEGAVQTNRYRCRPWTASSFQLGSAQSAAKRHFTARNTVSSVKWNLFHCRYNSNDNSLRPANNKAGAGSGGGNGGGIVRPVAQGVYNNAYFMHSATALVGSVVEVRLRSGNIYEGVFRTFSGSFDIALELPACIKSKNLPDEGKVPKHIIFPADTVVTIVAKDFDSQYATAGGFQTDGAISDKCNGKMHFFLFCLLIHLLIPFDLLRFP